MITNQREQYYLLNQLSGVDFMRTYLLEQDFKLFKNHNIQNIRGVNDVSFLCCCRLFFVEREMIKL